MRLNWMLRCVFDVILSALCICPRSWSFCLEICVLQVMILQCMNGKDRLELGLVDKEWYEASQDAILWRVLRLGSKMVEEEDIKVLKRLLHRRQPKTVLMAKTQLTPQLLRVLAECPSLEELFFDFCVTKTDSDILTLCCKPDSDLKVSS